MKYLNLGCGNNFSKEKEWTNLDFVSTGESVISHNLLNGIPFENETFDVVYHSHVLEHFSKNDGEKFIQECFRVLKPNGIIRIAVPDLESIVKIYFQLLERGLKNPEDKDIYEKYNWILLEMFDQMVRNTPGGMIGAYLGQNSLSNMDFIYERWGDEARGFRSNQLANRNKVTAKPGIRSKFRKILLRVLSINENALDIGNFRLNGEIHQWMYDKYSLSKLLQRHGGSDTIVRDAFTSYINNWEKYNLDGKDGICRKPDSLFIESIKK
ncbi:MAG: hypothetical protein RL222_731 [Bacteroidota bacterium]|jgi:predicted SAM-dependent methyltransferase